MLYSGFDILLRSVFWSANFNGRSDNLDVIHLRVKTMPARIPSDAEYPEIFWFSLCCGCGFETSVQSVGLIGRNESSTEHASYRAAWFNGTTNELHCDDFRAPIGLSKESFRSWVQEQVVKPVEAAYGNCFYMVIDVPAPSKIICPECQKQILQQLGHVEQHRYVNIDPGEFTNVKNPRGK